MKIPPIQRQGAINAYTKSRTQSVTGQSIGMKADAVEISADAASFGETFRAVMQALEEGTPKLAQRHEAAAENVRAGTYSVTPEQVAGAMLRGIKLDTEA